MKHAVSMETDELGITWERTVLQNDKQNGHNVKTLDEYELRIGEDLEGTERGLF
jgi:hypothetical protein